VVVWMVSIHYGGSDQLISRFGAKKVYGRMVQINELGARMHINRIGRILDQQAESLLAPTDGCLGLDRLKQIADRYEDQGADDERYNTSRDPIGSENVHLRQENQGPTRQTDGFTGSKIAGLLERNLVYVKQRLRQERRG
jgi:hypothetical protein